MTEKKHSEIYAKEPVDNVQLYKVNIISLTMNDPFGGFVDYQDEGSSTSNEHYKQLENPLMLTISYLC
jgi:hypothetical protein